MDTSLLYITNQDPNGVGGGCFASHAYLKAFSKIFDGRVTLCISDTCKEQDKEIKIEATYRVPQRSIVEKSMSVYTGDMHRFTKYVLKLIINNRTHFDYCVFDHNKLAGSLIKDIRSKGIKVITIHHNYEPEFFRANTTNKIVRGLFLRHVIKSERLAYTLSDFNLFLTSAGMEKFKNIYGHCKGKCELIGAFEFDEEEKVVVRKKNDNIKIAITGSLDNEQGVDGVRYFINDLYSVVDKTVKVIIAGKNPTDEVVELCNRYHNIELIPNPESIDDIITDSDIYLCPTRLGGGIKLRVMDGLRLGIPVITHSCSARGYDYFIDKPYFKVFDNCLEFKEKLQELIALVSRNSEFKIECQRLYYSLFSFDAGFKRLKKAIGL